MPQKIQILLRYRREWIVEGRRLLGSVKLPGRSR